MRSVHEEQVIKDRYVALERDTDAVVKETHAQLRNELLDHQNIVHGLQMEIESRDEELLSKETIYKETVPRRLVQGDITLEDGVGLLCPDMQGHEAACSSLSALVTEVIATPLAEPSKSATALCASAAASGDIVARPTCKGPSFQPDLGPHQQNRK